MDEVLARGQGDDAMSADLRRIFAQIAVERQSQDAEWGGPRNDDQHGAPTWVSMLTRFAGKSLDNDYRMGDVFRKRMVQVAAIAVAAIQANDRP